MPGPIIIHMPHASQIIPLNARALILFDDQRLTHELLRMTDAYTDEIISPGSFNVVQTHVSRPVVDVERASGTIPIEGIVRIVGSGIHAPPGRRRSNAS